MRFSDFLEDHAGFLITSFLFLMIESFLLLFLAVDPSMILLFAFLWFFLFSVYLCLEFYRKQKHQKQLQQLADSLDQKYLLYEVMSKGGSQEEQFYQYLLRIGNKSMLEMVSHIHRDQKEYQEYIEQWVHEIKTPIAAMKLWADNQQGSKKRELLVQVERVEHYVEQALFYARSETVEKDFCIQATDLQEAIQEALLQCKYLCTNGRVRVELPEETYIVQSDAKWIIFILNQLIENAVKYRKRDQESTLTLTLVKQDNNVELHVIDDGIGISQMDIDRVFEKGFTGENGRNANQHATGIGLFLCRKLCTALGIDLSITSVQGKGCDVMLRFVLTKL